MVTEPTDLSQEFRDEVNCQHPAGKWMSTSFRVGYHQRLEMLIQAVDRAQSSQVEAANPSSELSQGHVGGGPEGLGVAREHPEDPCAADLHGHQELWLRIRRWCGRRSQHSTSGPYSVGPWLDF